ncbi:agamous-like MADS-box protein AGL75 [Pistacia vera]|uniref:agamous-like MADS-box protein AGL75 n=1 Tax=Pistacia vera TaxID=55513 RepID=UPI001262E57F|nr:agamous-like MADS-box protein AGL75 [Pistacia vera]
MASAQKLNKRISTLKNKAAQLETLCDVKVCMVCFGHDGEVVTWPENKREVLHLINEVKAPLSVRAEQKAKHNCNLIGFLTRKKQKLNNKVENKKERKIKREVKKIKASNQDIDNLFSSWEAKLRELSDEKELVCLFEFLESRLVSLRDKIRLLQTKNFEKAVQVYNGDNTESDLNILNIQSYQPLMRPSPLLGGESSSNQQVCAAAVGSNSDFGVNIKNNLFLNGGFSSGYGHAIANMGLRTQEKFGFREESIDSCSNYGESMFCQTSTTPLHEVLPISMRQPWRFSNKSAQ